MVSPRRMRNERLTDGDLDRARSLNRRSVARSLAGIGGPGIGGPDFIGLGGDDDSLADMYVKHDERPAPATDLDFIAAARNYMPLLIAEVRQRRATASDD